MVMDQGNLDQWVAAVELRQYVSHRRTFYFLEQIILKHDAAARCVRIRQMKRGIDFFFANRSQAVEFVEFVGSFAPTRCHEDKQLVKSSTDNYKFTFFVEIAPICLGDLICFPPKDANARRSIGPLVICTKVTNRIALFDAIDFRLHYVNYWMSPFKSLFSRRQLVEYFILSLNPFSKVYIRGSMYVLAEARIVRASDFVNKDTTVLKSDMIFYVRTHLGCLLGPGDYALGYDLSDNNNNDIELDKCEGLELPEVVLIKRSYKEKREKKRGKPRSWKLKSLEMEVWDSGNKNGNDDEEKQSAEYEEFLIDLEENPDMRSNISLYRNEEYQPSEMADEDDDDDVPSIPLEELL